MFNPNEHLMNLKGKAYLQVMWRLVWFREDHPDWNIDTTMIEHTDNSAVFMAKIYDNNGVQLASGYGSESVKDFRDYIEKAETKAIGRALAMLGYGTQFAPELDEEERIVDSPVQRPNANKEPVQLETKCSVCGEVIKPQRKTDGTFMSVQEYTDICMKTYGRVVCKGCRMALNQQTQNAD